MVCVRVLCLERYAGLGEYIFIYSSCILEMEPCWMHYLLGLTDYKLKVCMIMQIKIL